MPTVKHLKSEQLKEWPAFEVGNTIKVHNRIKEGGKERIQIFEGVVIARKGGKGVNATFMVRKIASGVGVERIYPLHSPNIAKIEVSKDDKVRQAKIYYIRERRDNAPRTRRKLVVTKKMKEAAAKKEASKAAKAE
ncbi:MAG TPA: 50S ribosomal protein L19 [Patescibacteria group bacterium]|jgi:large subunit ribosomal protein L19|nr:50S ribosomal protein L19 [Patescibacteria group bacterium]